MEFDLLNSPSVFSTQFLTRIRYITAHTEMSENIQIILQRREGVETGCLVVSKDHMDGIVEAIKGSEIEVGEKHKSRFFRESSE